MEWSEFAEKFDRARGDAPYVADLLNSIEHEANAYNHFFELLSDDEKYEILPFLPANAPEPYGN